MTYNQRLIFLLSLIAVLALLFTGSFVFSPERLNTRSSSFAWLDSKLVPKISRIAINDEDKSFELLERSSQWFILHNGNEYPARQLRIEDFISILTTRAAWPVRASSASSRERFGLDEESAGRITVYGENTVLLDLLLGDRDISGQEVYLREFTQNEVRSGSNTISSYIVGPVTGWYNLRLIPESEEGQLDVESVQRISVYNNNETMIFLRRNRNWEVTGVHIEDPAQESIENYIRIVLNTEGDNFISDEMNFNHSSIVLEFDNGLVKTIRISEADETGRCFARVSGSEYTYSIPSWSAARLFRDASSFERQ